MFGQKPTATRQNFDAIIPARHCVNDAIEVFRAQHVLQGMIGLVEKDVEVLATVAVCPALLARSGDR